MINNISDFSILLSMKRSNNLNLTTHNNIVLPEKVEKKSLFARMFGK